jgi:hypothetical protein
MNRIEFMAMYRRFEGTVSEQHKIGCTTVLPRLLFHWSPTVDYGYEHAAVLPSSLLVMETEGARC